MTDVSSGFALTLPAGNGVKTVTEVQCPLGWSDVSQILMVFPPGCASLVGVAVMYAENVVYPVGPNPWFVLDGYQLVIPVTGQQQAGQWSIAGYNLDFNQHTVLAYFSWDYLTIAAQQQAGSLISL